MNAYVNLTHGAKSITQEGVGGEGGRIFCSISYPSATHFQTPISQNLGSSIVKTFWTQHYTVAFYTKFQNDLPAAINVCYGWSRFREILIYDDFGYDIPYCNSPQRTPFTNLD